MQADATAKQRMAALTAHPGWPELRSFYTERYDQAARDLGHYLLSGGKLDVEELARRQGQWRAVKTLLDTPEAFESMLQWEHRQQQQEEEETR